MNGKTFKVIVILVGLLFINIEAAQAGLIHRFKSFILHEFSDFQLFYMVSAIAAVGFLLYVLLTPVLIGNEKSVWLDYYPSDRQRSRYQNKKEMVKRISVILKTPNEN